MMTEADSDFSFCVPQNKKEAHTGLEQHDGEKITFN